MSQQRAIVANWFAVSKSSKNVFNATSRKTILRQSCDCSYEPFYHEAIAILLSGLLFSSSKSRHNWSVSVISCHLLSKIVIVDNWLNRWVIICNKSLTSPSWSSILQRLRLMFAKGLIVGWASQISCYNSRQLLMSSNKMRCRWEHLLCWDINWSCYCCWITFRKTKLQVSPHKLFRNPVI